MYLKLLNKNNSLNFITKYFNYFIIKNICKASSASSCNSQLLKINNPSSIHKHHISYVSLELFSSFFQRFNFLNKLKFPKYVLHKSALRMYLSCVEIVNHDLFIKHFGLPDTYNSWFRITELHLWLCMVRLREEGKEGLFIRNSLMEFLWQDMDKKIKKLDTMSSTTKRRSEMNNLNNQFRAALISYDEGLMRDDKVLAGALWRNFFERKKLDLNQLEMLIEYIHKQISFIDKIDSESILKNGIIDFEPLFVSQDYLAGKKIIIKEIVKRTRLQSV